MHGIPGASRRDLLRGLMAPLVLPRRWQADGEWKRLFNGRDLTGWETFLGKPHASVDLPGPRDAKGDHVNVVGVDVDPRRVFSVVPVDGRPAIRISGEIYGALDDARASWRTITCASSSSGARSGGRRASRRCATAAAATTPCRSARRELRVLDALLRVPDPGRGLRRLLQPRRRDRRRRGGAAERPADPKSD